MAINNSTDPNPELRGVHFVYFKFNQSVHWNGDGGNIKFDGLHG